VSKRAAEKAAKKAEAKAKKEAAKSTTPSDAPKAASTVADPFKQGWLKGVYKEKPVQPAEIHTRFPPEPNGYLHIGHAKAITVNFGFANSYGGQCNLRFDDTNPSKEEERYFTSIKEMVSWLGFQPARITHSSDEFDKLYELAEELVRRGKAYMCYCSKAEVKKGRGELPDGKKGPRSACAHWSKPVDENLAEFRDMRDGKYEPGTVTLRMKQNLATKPEEYEHGDDDSVEVKREKDRLKALSNNPALWDWAAYRVTTNSHHHRTGDKWRIYPTYEFTHCIVDALEGITHSLCTTEFETLRPAYNWLLEALDMKVEGSEEKGPMQREYGKLSVEGTILSKRNIAKLVDGMTVGEAPKADDVEDELADQLEDIAIEGEEEPELPSQAAEAATNGTGRKIPPVVKGWDDPRLFTLVGLRRRGVPPGALKKFVLDVGVTKAVAHTEQHSLDSTIRTYLERTVPRLMLVLDPIKVTFTNLPDDYCEERDVPFDPKDAEKGTHQVPFTKTIYIDRDDFREVDDPDFFRLSPNQSVGLLNAEHPIKCVSFSKDPSTGQVSEISAEYGAEVPRGKARIHWVGESAAHGSPIRAEARVFNPLVKGEAPKKADWADGSYHDKLNPESLVVYGNAMVECGLKQIRASAPWPKEEGEARGVVDRSSVRFQGLRTAFFCEDVESTEEKVVLNRIVSLKEDTGKK